MFINNYDQTSFSMNLLLEYFTKVDETFSPSELVDAGNRFLNKSNELGTWLDRQDVNYTLYAMKRITEAFGVVEAVSKMIEVAETNSPLTLSQWLEFIERKEELYDVPVSWLSSLLGG